MKWMIEEKISVGRRKKENINLDLEICTTSIIIQHGSFSFQIEIYEKFFVTMTF